MRWFRFVLFTALAGTAGAADYTALDRYVAAADSSYQYKTSRTLTVTGATIYQIEMVSQNWLTAAEVDSPEWRHWLTIVKPEKLSTSTALLFIDGGSTRTSPATPDATLTAVALATGMVVADLGQVPNEPLRFAGESATRTEDGIIAYTWDKFLRTNDDRWPLRLPMTKAAVRGMDTVTAFLAANGGPAVKNFVVAGGSKRGWTTWTTAIVDPRVIAIAPMVIDTLNLESCFIHHYRAYGLWAPAVDDYANAGIMKWFGTPQMTALLEIEDPYQYRERLALPKYLVNSAGDEFFLPDSSQFYFADLPGEKYLRYVPNTDHELNSGAITGLVAWLQAVTANYPRPRFYWKANRDQGTLTVRTIDTPSKVLLWQAENPKARDFRLETIGSAWTAKTLSGENGIYTVNMSAPEQGYKAFFVELTYPGAAETPLVFTTEVVVTPNTYAYSKP